MNPQIKIILSLSLLVLMGACSQKQESTISGQTQLIGSDLITDRPQTATWSSAIVRLKSPAVFSSTSFDGEITYDAKLLEDVKKEQAEVEQKLKELSKEIRIVFRYRFVMNALSVAYPLELESKVLAFGGASQVATPAKFMQPKLLEKQMIKSLSGPSSVDFIGATRAHQELGISGDTVKVGVIDSGIDYTHAMFNGPGTTAAYEAETGLASSALYPNDRVVGGIDLVGDLYMPGHLKPQFGLPYPDTNPLDRGGHGTHVAGTVAGLGDGDNTYDGVAPKASIYGIRVFGKGATGEDVVVAALEYAADPNGDGNPSDRLDVLNLSLGGNYGKPAIFYAEAMKNLANSGVLVAASAGNSGDIPFIVGSPSTAEGALSIAASIDNMEHNWIFKAAELQSTSGDRLVKRIEGTISKPIETYETLAGELVYIGLAATPLDDETALKLRGKVALIDRGEVGFLEKLQHAHAAGAIAAVVANNQPGEPIQMGGEGKVEIGAIMVAQEVGAFIKEQMKLAPVTIDFKSEQTIDQPELIDTITGFSSRGPRSHDGVLKPEITAPGQQIISAAMGKGKVGVAMNGTSMSSPHMAGVFALMRERFPKLTTSEIYDVATATSKIMMDADKPVAFARQGAGRVQVYEALQAQAVISPAVVNLGVQTIIKGKALARSLKVKNISDEPKTYNLEVYEGAGLKIIPAQKTITLAAGAETTVDVVLELSVDSARSSTLELEGHLFFNSDSESYHVTFFGVSRLTGQAKVQSLTTRSATTLEREGSTSQLVLQNNSSDAAPVEIFNLIGLDERKPTLGSEDVIRSRHCDLQAAGYRIVNQEGEDFIQFGLKIYHPVSRWQVCEVSIQIDADGDGTPEQELAGIDSENLYGLAEAVAPGHYSVLLNAPKTRALRLEYELGQWGQVTPERTSPNFVPAIIDLLEQKTYDFSTLSIVNARLSKLAASRIGELRVKVAVLHENPSANSADDYLGLEAQWLTLPTAKEDQAYSNIPVGLKLAAMQSSTVNLEAGRGDQDLMVVLPANLNSPMGSTRGDQQLFIVKEKLSN